MSGPDAKPPSLRESSTCRRLLAGLAYRMVWGAVLPPNPVASSRPTDERASQCPIHVQPLLSDVRAWR